MAALWFEGKAEGSPSRTFGGTGSPSVSARVMSFTSDTHIRSCCCAVTPGRSSGSTHADEGRFSHAPGRSRILRSGVGTSLLRCHHPPWLQSPLQQEPCSAHC